jgi:hypothetical protein
MAVGDDAVALQCRSHSEKLPKTRIAVENASNQKSTLLQANYEAQG